MSRISPPSRRVVWMDGMHLAPQHFQSQRRYHEEQLARTFSLMVPFAYGLSALAIDDEALANGTFSLLEARGILPDGTPFSIPDVDDAPEPVALADRFSPVRDSHDLFLVLPEWQPDAANVSSDPADDFVRFREHKEILIDESSGSDPLPIRFAARNFRVLLDDELEQDHGLTTLALGRVQRDGRGQYRMDRGFIPPCVHLGASERLVSLNREIVDLLETRGNSLVAALAKAPSAAAGGSVAYQGNELATRWLLHSVRSATSPLRHLMSAQQSHPERLYTELSRLAGALCTFSASSHPSDVALYDHTDLSKTFDALERLIRLHLDMVVSVRSVVMPLQQQDDLLHSTHIQDPMCFEPGARWFLAVRAPLDEADLIDRVQRLTKTCASKFVLELVRRAYNGLVTEHIPVPPSALAPKPGLTYFELQMSGPCAVSLKESREMGVYVPEAIPGAYLELAVLLPK